MAELIDRQAAIKKVQAYHFRYPEYMDGFVNKVLSAIKVDLVEDIEELPTAEPRCYLGSPCEYQNAEIRLPTAEPYNLDEWCDDCKEYDNEKHSCPRFNRVIRTAMEEAMKETKGEGNGI